MSKKALVIGGLGFIGSHISKIFSSNGLAVTIAKRSKLSKGDIADNFIQLDLDTMPVETVKELVKGFSFIIFCGGADDRSIPVGDAEKFYYEENVTPCLKLVEASLDTEVEKIVLLGSYFSYFDRQRPELKLKERHPYIKSRYLQQTECTELAQGKIRVSVLEIPYVFGTAPGKIPIWKPLVNYIDKMPVVFYTKGGSTIVSVEQVAKATLGILNAKEYRPYWVVGSENVTWTQLIQMISLALGKKRSVISVPSFMAKFFASLTMLYFKLTNRQSGLDLYHFIDLQTSNAFMELDDSMKKLDYEKVDMQQSIDAMVKACGYKSPTPAIPT